MQLFKKRSYSILAGFMIHFLFILAAALILSNNQTFAATNNTKSSIQEQNKTSSVSFTKHLFANEILHWTQTEFHAISQSPDPNNGKPITGDIWVSVGGDGIPLLIHTRYTDASGAFLQESIQTRDTETINFGKGYSDAGCQIVHKQFSQAELLSALPSFTQNTSLSAAGFLKSGSQTHALPVTRSIAGITPVESYISGTSTAQWSHSRAFANSKTDVQTFSINSDGRVVMNEVKLFDSTGKIVQDNWHTYGTLFVYNTKDIPATIYAQQIQGGCNA